MKTTDSPVEEEKRRLRWKFLYVGRDGRAAGHLPWDCTNALKLLVVAKAANSLWQQLGRETEQRLFQVMTTRRSRKGRAVMLLGGEAELMVEVAELMVEVAAREGSKDGQI